jgi:hypothetical protein
MISALVTLRVFAFGYVQYKWGDVFLHIMEEAYDRAPHIEYMARFSHVGNRYWKQVGGQWVICDEEEFPSFE